MKALIVLCLIALSPGSFAIGKIYTYYCADEVGTGFMVSTTEFRGRRFNTTDMYSRQSYTCTFVNQTP